MTLGRRVTWLATPLLLAACATAPRPQPGTMNSPLPGREPVPSTATTGTAGGATKPGASPSPIPGTPVGTTASGGTITATSPRPAVVDTVPSAEALAVLATIPEPLSPAERGAAPMVRPSGGGPAAGSAVDSSGAGPDSAGVPVPAPTQPLGDRPGALVKAADSVATSGAGGRWPAAPVTRPIPPDSCWRLQVAAPPEEEKARALRDAAQSQLLVPMTIEVQKGLHKVRTRDCLSAEAAEQLKRRALAAGFAGAFRFKGAGR